MKFKEGDIIQHRNCKRDSWFFKEVIEVKKYKYITRNLIDNNIGHYPINYIEQEYILKNRKKSKIRRL